MQTASKKVVNGWAMYDWANSVYNLVITTTFFPIYFMAVTKGDHGSDKVNFLGREFVNSSLYDYILATCLLIDCAFISHYLPLLPIQEATRKISCVSFCYMGALGCSLLFFFNEI